MGNAGLQTYTVQKLLYYYILCVDAGRLRYLEKLDHEFKKYEVLCLVDYLINVEGENLGDNLATQSYCKSPLLPTCS